MTESIKMSRASLAKLETELKRLKFEERPKIVAEIKRSMELGDLSENAEYHAAKETQRYIEAKLADLEFKLARVEIVDTDAIPSDKVYLYARVLVKDMKDGEEIEYTITPAEEADLDNDIISINSPVAKAMLGKSVGDKVEIKVPIGTITYEILKISRD
jgi:transcription elongation factor GreA